MIQHGLLLLSFQQQGNQTLALKRKSSNVNARGIPPAAQQVLAMLGGGLAGVPHPVMVGEGGTPSSHGRGYPRYPPPSRPGIGYPPPPFRPRIGYLPHHPDLGWGTPHHQTWDGVPPPTNGEQTRHSQV